MSTKTMLANPPLDWDKLRIFHTVMEMGSFTRAASTLALSQSAISRQIGALEHEVGTSLFHRHARGLIPTEQGELLYRTAHEVLLKLEAVKVRLEETTNRPSGKLRITTTVGFGQGWLTDRIQEFQQLYPEIQVQLLLDNDEVDVDLRFADCAIRLRQPHQVDLIQRKLFTVHLHLYAAQSYLTTFGEPRSVDDLDHHRIITFGEPAPAYLLEVNWLETAGRETDERRIPVLQVNSQTSIKQACKLGIGIACLPDYIVGQDPDLIRLPFKAELPSFDTYFCYPPEIKNSAKLRMFGDFIISNSRSWSF